MAQVLTRIEIDKEGFLIRARELGFPSIEAISEASRQEGGKSLALGTIHKILANTNYHIASLERLAEVTNISLDCFVSFQPTSRHG